VRKVRGFIAGPVRVVVLTNFAMILIGRIPTPSMAFEELIYRDSLFFGGQLFVPIQPDFFLSKLKIQPVIHLSNVVNDATVMVDGFDQSFSMAATELPPITGFPAWFCAQGGFGRVGGGVVMGDAFRKVIEKGGSQIKLERLPDNSINYIWVMDGIKYLRRGTYGMLFSMAAGQRGPDGACREMGEELEPTLHSGLRLLAGPEKRNAGKPEAR